MPPKSVAHELESDTLRRYSVTLADQARRKKLELLTLENKETSVQVRNAKYLLRDDACDMSKK